MKSVTTPGGLPGARPLRRAALALLPLLAACGGGGGSGGGDGHLARYPQTTFRPASEMAEVQMDLFNLTLWMGVGVGLLTFAAIGYIMMRYRYRPEAPEPRAVHGSTLLEVTWTLLPALIVAIIAVFTVRAIFITQPEPPENALTVRAIGKQWWWEFRYPVAGGDTVVTANEIHVPVG
ncbi:MAG TPA: cytochrome c oxidase subunit II, partial [Longimicrobium sp.]|nr:cytochrome c oxidase subunit II [Longimicrobium sp.]